MKNALYPRWDKKMLALRKITYKVGRRGSYLLFLALLDFLFGYSLMTTPAVEARLTDLILPYKVWGVIWIIVGAFCLWQAFVKLDRLAYSLSVTLSAIWGVVMLISWYHSQIDPNGWITGVIFLAFGLLTGIVSYWPEHHAIPEREGR